jgi:hypothetical protein
MDAPQGRYRVVEKDGRLVVIDNETGGPIPSSIATPPRPRGGNASPSPVAPAGPGPIDRAAGFLVTLAAREWDGEGRAIITWKWTRNGRERRWDAALDERQQRRLGRALLALVAAPLLLFFLFFAGGTLSAVATLLTLPPAAWAAVSIQRLYRETNDPGLGPSS